MRRSWTETGGVREVLAVASGRRINNPPQVGNLPHKPRAFWNSETGGSSRLN